MGFASLVFALWCPATPTSKAVHLSSHLTTPHQLPPLSPFPFPCPSYAPTLPPSPYPHLLIHAKPNHFCCYKMAHSLFISRAPYCLSPSHPLSLASPRPCSTPHHASFLLDLCVIRRGTTHSLSLSISCPHLPPNPTNYHPPPAAHKHTHFFHCTCSEFFSTTHPQKKQNRAKPAKHASDFLLLVPYPLCLCTWRDLSSLLALFPNPHPHPTHGQQPTPLFASDDMGFSEAITLPLSPKKRPTPDSLLINYRSSPPKKYIHTYIAK